jgi:maltose alpha-D-glucosyltransferase/alpha-amylase
VGERLLKRSPLFDVAGMLRSFQYAADAAFAGRVRGVTVRPEDVAALEPWARLWYAWVSAVFLSSYFEAAAPARLLPEDPADIALLLDAHVLEKALYELEYELNNRPDWVVIPLRGIGEILGSWKTDA